MRDHVRWMLCCLLTLIAVRGECFAQEGDPPSAGQPAGPTDARSDDLSAIRVGSKVFVDAFNNQDAHAVAALWTEEGEYVDDAGRVFTGRDAIEQGYAEFFADNPQAEISIMIDSIRLLSDSTAIEDGRALVEPAPEGAPGFSKYTVMHVKEEGKWFMASVRDTWIETPSAHDNVSDLQWLIGTWLAEEHGAKTESVCRWVANKSFVERDYTTTQVDGTKTSGVQMIGWNPLTECVQSWNFSPDGGHAVGVWVPEEGGWRAEMDGVTGTGITTTATNVLQRLDDNAYVWQSIQRTADGIALPDTDEIVMKRQAANR